MVKGKCNNPDCTVAETGICLESHQDVKECPFFAIEQNTEEESATSGMPTIARRFHSGNELGTNDVIGIMRKRYTHLVGILGSTNVGKTCLISAFYLLASQGELLPEYLFAGSFSLQGYEQRVRRLRNWADGRLPDQLVEHTHLENPRSPAFMHLCLQENKPCGKYLDILLTDLPGEWTDDLIDRESAASRLNFLKRADGIIFMIDGPRLKNPETKHLEIYRSKLAIDRLIENVNIAMNIPFILAISKCDDIDMQTPDGLIPIIEHAQKSGLSVISVLTSAFSRKPNEIKSGYGVFNAIRATIEFARFPKERLLKYQTAERSFWLIQSK